MQNNLAIIPARSGSKGVLDKNIRELGGYPLINWSIKACQKAKNIDRIIVSTDSQQYADIAISCGAEVPFLRPDNISGDDATDFSFISHALQFLAQSDYCPDLLVHIRPTTPFRDPILIDNAISTFLSEPSATALRSIHEMSESAYKSFELSSTGKLMCLGKGTTELDSANKARQKFPPTYQANGYVDVLSPAFIKKNSLLHGDSVLPFITPRVVEVDTYDDFAQLEWILHSNPELSSSLFL